MTGNLASLIASSLNLDNGNPSIGSMRQVKFHRQLEEELGSGTGLTPVGTYSITTLLLKPLF